MATKRKRDVNISLDKISQLGYEYHGDENERNRKALLSEAKRLCRMLETPQEAVIRMAWVEPVTHVVIRIAISLNIFAYLKSGEPLSPADLARLTKAEQPLIIRIMNHLAATGIVSQPAADLYNSTPLSLALTDPGQRDAIPWIQKGIQPVFSILPQYLKNGGWKDTNGNGWKGPFQKAHATELHMFEWLKEHPELHSIYKNHLAGYASQSHPYWTDIYPLTTRTTFPTATSFADLPVLFVDIGGNLGRDALLFRQRFPSLKGRVISQDLAHVISSAPPAASQTIELVAHDFFTPQPASCRHACIYFLHFVLHDWSNDDCLRILKHVKEAMGKGSKLIVNEVVVPEDPEVLRRSEVGTSLDWIVMAAHAGRERTEGEWRSLLGDAGFEVQGVWMGEGGEEGVIEAVLDDD